jgi:hypothetical protein
MNTRVTLTAIQYDYGYYVAVRHTMLGFAIVHTELWCEGGDSGDAGEGWRVPGDGWTPVKFDTREEALKVGRRQRDRCATPLALSRRLPK